MEDAATVGNVWFSFGLKIQIIIFDRKIVEINSEPFLGKMAKKHKNLLVHEIYEWKFSRKIFR